MREISRTTPDSRKQGQPTMIIRQDAPLFGCVCRKPHPCWWSERIGYPGGMIALILFVLGILASPFKAKSRLEAENAALRQQLIVLRRKVKGRARLTNTDRCFFVQLYRWFPSILEVLAIVRPETLVRWHRAGFRHSAQAWV